MVDIIKESKKIILVSFYANLVFLIISLFVTSRYYGSGVLIFNIIFMGSFLLFQRGGENFNNAIGTNVFFQNIDKILEKLLKTGEKDGKVS